LQAAAFGSQAHDLLIDPGDLLLEGCAFGHGFEQVVTLPEDRELGLQFSRLVLECWCLTIEEGDAIGQPLLPLFKGLFCTTNPIPVKAALELTGWPVGAPRLPLVSADSDVRQRLSSILAALRPT
jgi:hypothetical protein